MLVGHVLKPIRENKLMVFERKMFGPKRNEDDDCEIRKNRDLNNVFDESCAMNA